MWVKYRRGWLGLTFFSIALSLYAGANAQAQALFCEEAGDQTLEEACEDRLVGAINLDPFKGARDKAWGFIADKAGDAAKEVGGGLASGIGNALHSLLASAVEITVSVVMWFLGRVDSLIEGLSSPDLSARWFVQAFGHMMLISAILALLFFIYNLLAALFTLNGARLKTAVIGSLSIFAVTAASLIILKSLLTLSDELTLQLASIRPGSTGGFLESIGAGALEGDANIGVKLLAALLLVPAALILWLEFMIRAGIIYVTAIAIPIFNLGLIAGGKSLEWTKKIARFLLFVTFLPFMLVLGLLTATLIMDNAAASFQGVEMAFLGFAVLIVTIFLPILLALFAPGTGVYVGSMARGANHTIKGAGTAASRGAQRTAAASRKIGHRGHERPPSTSTAGTNFKMGDNQKRSAYDSKARRERVVAAMRSDQDLAAPSGSLKNPPAEQAAAPITSRGSKKRLPVQPLSHLRPAERPAHD